ncbi:UDP-4-amino-4,6-dideoxy-N-acetyl-beta-L-altrosamine transaminase [Candidatus Pelagibacter sp. HIMB1506]|uniref:UDP-4-amino-4, 6-dideoxy-N-acetyl-beta-L-altrosamine transaminase n=1 Tax=Candidatus Pelagibacter sp. HIMB1506 TaxID=3413337 RepID=UPI003F851BE9
MIPYSRQEIDKKDIRSVEKVLKSRFITQGNQINIFEKKICNKVGSKYSVAVNSATSALHIACLALDLKEKDYLWTVPNTFVASANCGLYCGALIDFVDIDKDTLNISIENLKKKLIEAKKKKKIPKIIVAVDFGGNPYDHKKLFDLSLKYNFKIITDASHSLGSSFKNYKIGRCKWSDITVFSFHPVKPITTAEGGMAVTNDKLLFEKLKILRNHGISRNINKYQKKIRQKWYYEQIDLGYNYRMNELQAALGISQLNKLDSFNLKRNKIAKFYKNKLKNLPIKFQEVDKNSFSSYHLFVVLFPKSIIKKKIYNKIFNFFLKNKIDINLHYLPLHLHPFFRSKGFKEGSYLVSEEYSKRAISLPIYPSLTFQNQNKIVNIINKVFKKYFKNEIIE